MNDVEQLEANQFYAFTENGYSRPARVQCCRANGSTIDAYLKFVGGVEGRGYGLATELICSLLARELGLATPTPYIVHLSPEFLEGVPRDAKDLVKRSLGLNFASESAPPGFSVVPPEPRVPLALRPMAAKVFAFDVLVQNCDRKADNPNMLWDKTKIMLIDHERALGLLHENPIPSLVSLQLDRYYDHVFYSAISPHDSDFADLADALGRLSTEQLEALLGKVPESWEVKEDLARVLDHLSWVVQNRVQVCQLIHERLS
jgi:hypothetical protein